MIKFNIETRQFGIWRKNEATDVSFQRELNKGKSVDQVKKSFETANKIGVAGRMAAGITGFVGLGLGGLRRGNKAMMAAGALGLLASPLLAKRLHNKGKKEINQQVELAKKRQAATLNQQAERLNQQASQLKLRAKKVKNQ